MKNHFGFNDSNVSVTMLYWVLHSAFHVPRLLSKASETNRSGKKNTSLYIKVLTNWTHESRVLVKHKSCDLHKQAVMITTNKVAAGEMKKSNHKHSQFFTW